jgi:hypothetical protein
MNNNNSVIEFKFCLFTTTLILIKYSLVIKELSLYHNHNYNHNHKPFVFVWIRFLIHELIGYMYQQQSN